MRSYDFGDGGSDRTGDDLVSTRTTVDSRAKNSSPPPPKVDLAVPQTPSNISNRFDRIVKAFSSSAKRSSGSRIHKALESQPDIRTRLFDSRLFSESADVSRSSSKWSPSPKKTQEFYVPQGLSERVQQTILGHEARVRIRMDSSASQSLAPMRIVKAERWNRHAFYVTLTFETAETSKQDSKGTQESDAVLVCINKAAGYKIKSGVRILVGAPHSFVMVDGKKVDFFHEWCLNKDN